MTGTETRFTVEGLVIKEMNIGESDRMVTLFTREFGIMRAFAAGAKSIKSKKAAATNLLTYSSFTIKQKNGSLRIYEAIPIAQFFSMGSDIELLSISQYFCEICYKLGEENSPNPELLRLILNSLHFLVKEKRNSLLIKAVTELRTAVICGYSPNLVACDNCGMFEDRIMYFNLFDGSLTCSSCKNEQAGIPIDRTLLSALRHITYSEFKKLYSFEIPEKSIGALSTLTERYLTTQTETHFDTLDFFNSIS